MHLAIWYVDDLKQFCSNSFLLDFFYCCMERDLLKALCLHLWIQLCFIWVEKTKTKSDGYSNCFCIYLFIWVLWRNNSGKKWLHASWWIWEEYYISMSYGLRNWSLMSWEVNLHCRLVQTIGSNLKIGLVDTVV